MSKRCLIIGHKGQDGRLLTEQLQARGSEIRGIGRDDIALGDRDAIAQLLALYRPDEIYYLAAFHHSSEEAHSLSDAELTRLSFAVHRDGIVSWLEEIARTNLPARVFYAASSHVFGRPDASPQNEDTPLQACNIYGASKAAGIEACHHYRRSHGTYVSCGILYNHESPYRSEKFVSQKIVRGAVAIQRGEQSRLILGNLDAAIDWGYARDYADAMTRILALPKPDDFIIATGETHTVREFADLAFAELGLSWQSYVDVQPSILQKDLPKLVGDSSKLRSHTGWHPTVNFPEMVSLMVKGAI